MQATIQTERYNFRFADVRYPLYDWMELEHVKQMMQQNNVSVSVIEQHRNDSMTCSDVQAFAKTYKDTATSSDDMDYSIYGGQQPVSAEQVEEDGEILTKTTFADGDTEYTNQANQVHRTNGPAIIKANGTQYYYQYSNWHREDGPAWVRPDGSGEYYINGKWVKSTPSRDKVARQLKKYWS